ncbi:MAG TPA: beta-galactosidase [Candidatus Brocadiia bacterium]|nr:beta-galactosidase [Candidatus Brocadiia bacterium]
MNLGVQYYRPPFPDSKYWEADFARISESGLNTVQLWIKWAWVEPKPGEFRYDDYDRLVELAAKNNLGVILSTIAEIHPYWIHREVPGSEMIDHMGQKVVSSNRGECHFGLTPGGCFDHPGVWERMANFISTTAKRYKDADHVRGWDAWNELRWNVQSDALVCYCDHTLAAYRKWLSDKFGGLDDLNNAWKRRYGCWEEVWPGKLPSRPYTEMMAFQHFLTWRADRHAKMRYDIIKPIVGRKPVTVHAGSPSPLTPGWQWDHAINRGNDWAFADALDGVGCSSFPKWEGIDDADFGMRVECVKSAAQGKLVWLSEVQGGRSAHGFNIYPAVDAPPQQRWIWNGLACGADTIIFWCWRDEVFGSESAGFGLIGLDGLADERLAAMRETGRLLEENKDLFSTYQPSKAEVGVFFSPQAYYLDWAQEHNAVRIMNGLRGYARSLVRNSIPYVFVEEEHLGALDGLKILFMPRAIVTDPKTEEALANFVRNGGTLVCESECGAFNSQGFYRYPEDRFTAKLAGIAEVGRRFPPADGIATEIAGSHLKLGAAQWITPWQKRKGKVLAPHDDGALIVEAPVGKGRLLLCGAYLGDAYLQNWTADFETFIAAVVRNAGWKPQMEVVSPKPDKGSFVYIKSGESAGCKVVFAFFPEGCDEAKLRFAGKWFPSGKARDLIGGRSVKVSNVKGGQECRLSPSKWKLSVLVSE